MSFKLSNKNAVLWSLALIAVFLAFVSTAHSLLTFSDSKNKIKARRNTLAALKGLECEYNLANQPLDNLKSLPSPLKAAPLQTLASELTTATNVEITERGVKNLSGGWQIRQAELQAANIKLEQLGFFISAASKQQPAWVLQACKIESAAQAGFAKVSLLLEALERN